MFTEELLNRHSEDILFRIMLALKVSKHTQLAKIFKVTPQSISNAAKKRVPVEWIEKICTEKFISPIYLLTGEGNTYEKGTEEGIPSDYYKRSDSENIRYHIEIISMLVLFPSLCSKREITGDMLGESSNLKRYLDVFVAVAKGGLDNSNTAIPILEWDKVATWIQCNDDIKERILKGESIEALTVSKENMINTGKRLALGAFSLQVSTDSMESDFLPGDFIVVDPQYSQISSGDYIITEINGDIVFRKYISEAGQIYLKANNPIYDIITIKKSEFVLIGKVVRKIQDH